MTLSNVKVRSELARNFVVGWTNISGQAKYAGSSNVHYPDYPARMTTNCAGHHNVQMFFLTGDGRIVHCLPGFWEPKAFLEEVALARKLDQLDRSRLSIAEKNEKFLDLHLEHALAHDAALREASRHQHFDAHALQQRGDADFVRTEGFVPGGLKTPDQVLHERMAERPFLTLAEFDVADFVDMGLTHFAYPTGVAQTGPGATPAGSKR